MNSAGQARLRLREGSDSRRGLQQESVARARPNRFLVPKLCLETHLSSKLRFADRATELPGQFHSQTEFGNEGAFGNEE